MVVTTPSQAPDPPSVSRYLRAPVSPRALLIAFAASTTLGPAVVAGAEAQTPAAVTASSASDIAKRIDGFYSGLTTFKATFTQSYGASAHTGGD